MAAPRRLGLRCPGRLGASEGGELVPACARGGAQRAELRERLTERAIRVAQRGLELQIPLRHGLGEDPPLGREIRLRGRSLDGDPLPVAGGSNDLARGPRLAEAQARERSSRSLVDHPAFALQLRAGSHRCRDLRDAGFPGFERLERPISLGAQHVTPVLGVGGPGRCLVPPPVCGRDQRRGKLLACRAPRGLLLGQLPKPACLWPELGEDVLDAGEVGLGLLQLGLRLAPPALMTADAGHLLEQRPALLGPQRQGLVHHALADEQERVLGKTRAVQQVDEVAEPHALLVEQVVVLTGSVEPAAQLHNRVLHGEQGVAVVEHQCDVGHPLGAALLGSRPDHVLALADPEGPALLAERPAERVREIRLA